MSYRGSLSACVKMMATQFSLHNHTQLLIVRNRQAKYCTLLTPEEYANPAPGFARDHNELLLNCTEPELRIIHSLGQTTLDLGGN